MSCIPKKSTADQQQFVAPPAQAMSTAVDCEERAPGDVLQGGGKGGAGVSELSDRSLFVPYGRTLLRLRANRISALTNCFVPCVFTVQHRD